MQPVTDPLNALADRHSVFSQNIYNRPLHLQRLQAHTDRQAGLTVQVNQEDPLSLRRQGHAEIVRRCGLRHAALLICDCYNFQILHSSSHLYSLRLLFKLYKLYCLFLKSSSRKRCSRNGDTAFYFICTKYLYYIT